MPSTRRVRLQLVLASASPRRLSLLRDAGLRPRVIASGAAEDGLAGETPRARVVRLARRKADAVAVRLGPAPPSLVLAADTEVVLDGETLGKPRDAADALRMLRRLCGRSHEVWTGVVLRRTDDDRATEGAECTRVHFREVDVADLERYVASGEPLDKAGAYGIQGRGALLAQRLEGSWTNVVGLPLERLPEWMAAVGVDAWELTDGPQADSANEP